MSKTGQHSPCPANRLKQGLCGLDAGIMLETKKTRLLLVDDDDLLRETLCAILEHDGFEVRTAAMCMRR